MAGAETTGAVWRSLGCTPLCGRCGPVVKSLLEDRRGCAADPAAALVPLAAE